MRNGVADANIYLFVAGSKNDRAILSGKKKKRSIRRSLCICESGGKRYILKTERG
jgi:hypothetical protein